MSKKKTYDSWAEAMRKGKETKNQGILGDRVAEGGVRQDPLKGTRVEGKDLKPDPIKVGVEGSVIGSRQDWDISRR